MKVLVATDGSRDATEAVETPSFVSPALSAALKDYEAERRRELGGVVAAAAEEFRWRAGRVVSATPVGTPAEVIIRDAEEHRSDLIVVGARGRNRFERFVLGSVSESVLRHAGCPVVVARPRG